MRPSFYPRRVNGPFDDPGLFVPFVFESRALMFDLGDNYNLSTRDILKTSHVFVSHTHMDHFIGFDRLLRLLLGREKKIYMYGPEGFLNNLEGKLTGYSWNLVSEYKNRFMIQAAEVRRDSIHIRQFACRDRFIPTSEQKKSFNGVLHEESSFKVSSIILDHRIPCLGFSIQERFHINILKENLLVLGLSVGPWLREFKQALFDSHDLNSVFTIPDAFCSGQKQFTLGELADRIAIISPGQKISYITDCLFSKENIDKIIKLVSASDELFIEGAFLDKDHNLARDKAHLTAWQAGFIARKARVKKYTLFHFSPRYAGMEHLLLEEAKESFQALKPKRMRT
jgi:ribonuclease Z